ncbi:MAG: hypothetical protein MZV64_71885 [Ignavibacteriales bacterium]|nr:hypothetical protein [Ignavibacteriales bacterium]
MTMTEMNSISTPASGLMIFNTTDNNFYFFNGIGWSEVVGSDDGDWTISGSNIYSSVFGNVGIGTTGPTQKLHVVEDSGLPVPFMMQATMPAISTRCSCQPGAASTG